MDTTPSTQETTTPIQFREEVLKKFFDYIKSGESFYVLGAPSVGKTRLMDFLMGDDPDSVRLGIKPKHQRVKNHYLGPDLAVKTWLARVDMNRLRSEGDVGFHFFELLLSTILFACNKNESSEENEEMKLQLAKLDAQVIESKDALKAHRLLEMAVNNLYEMHGVKICFLFDEFDVPYQEMPSEIFSQLRGMRDANKYRVSYALFLRNLPERLRSPAENESFYELISRNMIGLGPHSPQDTYHIIRLLELRRGFELSPKKRDWVCANSGGHPGLIQALFTIFKEKSSAVAQMENIQWFVAQESVREEFRKLWMGLLEEEKNGLSEFARGNNTVMPPIIAKSLISKGLLRRNDTKFVFFCPSFEKYILSL